MSPVAIGLMVEVQGPKSEHAKAKVAALRLLARRARTRADLSGRLRRKGFSAAAIMQALDELGQAGYVDDAKYAEERIDALLRRSKHGSAGLIDRLIKDGLDADLAEQAVAEYLRDVDEREWAREVAAERLEAMPDLDRDTAKRRLYNYLRRRGFSNEDIVRAVEEVLPHEA